MEEKISLAWEDAGCVFTIKGRLEKEDIRRMALQEFADERFEHAKFLIVDLLEADYSIVSQRDISIIVAHTFDTPSENPDMKLAIVATDPHVIGMSEYYLSMMSNMEWHWEARMFKTLEDARAWVEA